MGESDMPYREEEERGDRPTLSEGLRALPVLEDDMYLQLQAFNLGIVDSLLRDWERDLLAEYHASETTPVPTAVVVSAVGQLWVFGLYELLRTWRQRVRELLRFGESLAAAEPKAPEQMVEEQKLKVQGASADPARPNPAHVAAFERVANDPQFLDRLRDAFDRSELPYRKLEAVRIHLAKHEIPKVKGSYAMTPGYTRIDEVTQSICWEVFLGEMEVEIVSRRSLADRCRTFGTDPSVVILPPTIQDALVPLPTQSYGVKSVTLVLADGAEREAFVAWNRQVLKVIGMPPIAIDPRQVVAVRHTPDTPAA